MKTQARMPNGVWIAPMVVALAMEGAAAGPLSQVLQLGLGVLAVWLAYRDARTA